MRKSFSLAIFCEDLLEFPILIFGGIRTIMVKKVGLTFGIIAIFSAALLTVSCMKSGPEAGRKKAEALWGSERVCLPCHIYQKPIARNHNYRCDTCHRGNPWSEDLEEGHFEMVRAPQQPAYVGLTCDKCHRRVLGRDVPYDAEFIRDVLVSHQMKLGETLEWKE